MENPLKTFGVKVLNCGVCGVRYPIVEFYKIASEVGKLGVEFPQYADLLMCIQCWRKEHPGKMGGKG